PAVLSLEAGSAVGEELQPGAILTSLLDVDHFGELAVFVPDLDGFNGGAGLVGDHSLLEAPGFKVPLVNFQLAALHGLVMWFAVGPIVGGDFAACVETGVLERAVGQIAAL